ncbi:hypothetical protein OG225_17115 [Nocardia sp. NBC_01377]|uniref:hypothetical protein n=1 Tax=Nocardia sp. NBC_01377 TaxID=2903595 RepID=UPI0032561B0E
MDATMATRDVHLRIRLAGRVFDYAATAEAARNMIADCASRCWCVVELVDSPDDLHRLPRLPCERLFRGP